MSGKVKAPREGRRSPGIGHQVLVGFGIFTLVIVALLWIFQISLLGTFYRGIKTGETRRVAKELVNNLDSETLEVSAQGLCADTGMSLYVLDERGSYYVAVKYNLFQESLLDNANRLDLQEIFNQVNLRGGEYSETFTTKAPGREGIQLYLYAKIVRTQGRESRMVLVESEITPVDSTVDTLTVQLIWLTGVMVALGLVLALVLSRKISRPLQAINASAKCLAAGDYQTQFTPSGGREVQELAETLNYAAGELSKVEQLRRELLANVSHDLRTPLTMIKGYSEVMRDLPGENTPENAQVIVEEATRLTDLVNDLLDLSRLEAGVQALQKSRFNLTQNIRAMLHRYDKLAGYAFPFYADQEACVEADELKISQVVYNLVNNAITFIGGDKTVTLRQTLEGEKVRISVSDTGEGIPADQLRDIWERYYKVDKEHKRARVGTGLGLSIVKNILDMHGGSYGVESQPGVGSTFWFELPVGKELPSLPAQKESAQKETNQKESEQKERIDENE